MKFTTLLLLIGSIEAIKINEAPAKTLAVAATVAADAVPESNVSSEAPAAIVNETTKPLTESEIIQARSDAAWAKYTAKKLAYDEYIEDANLKEWRKSQNASDDALSRYKNMTAGIEDANQQEINVSVIARQIIGNNATNSVEANMTVGEDSKDEAWAYEMPHHVINATKGPSENVTTAKIEKFYVK